jgi:NADPH:quinone reductase-like Zn-dependent oxidoreductase
MLLGSFGEKKVGLMMYKPNKCLDLICKIFEEGKLEPVIDKIYPLSATPEAFRYFGEQNHLGKLVIKVV